jgi:hypothetical protein
MPRLLVVHHTTSPALQAMFEAVMAGATDEAIEDVTVLARPALAATAVDVLEADGYLLGTPANLGYMSGARQGDRGDRAGPAVAPRAGAGDGARRPGPRGPAGLLGAGRRDGGGPDPRLSAVPVADPVMAAGACPLGRARG